MYHKYMYIHTPYIPCYLSMSSGAFVTLYGVLVLYADVEDGKESAIIRNVFRNLVTK